MRERHGEHDLAIDPVARRVLERAEVEGIELIRFLYADHGGVIRGKASSRSRLAERIGTGIGHTVAMMAMSMLDTLQDVEGLGPVGEVRIVPDPSTFVPLPYAPGAAAMLADLRLPDGSPWEACPRTFLKDAVAELAREGYALVAAFEPEFTLGRRLPDSAGGPDRLVPLDDSLCYSTTGFDLAHDYVIKLMRALEAQGMRVEHYYPELGPGQQELSIRHAAALRAADNQVLYRETVRGIAFRMTLWASLAPKPIPGQAGNGAHLHLSLWDVGESGRAGPHNLFSAPGDRHGLSATGYHFIGGLLEHLPALTALTSGTVNGFRRLAPQTWASAYRCYGLDNREAAVRICSPVGAGSVNLEFKPSDSSANPYLSLGAVIHAGLDGVRRGLDPGEPMTVDPATLTEAERAKLGATRLPTSLDEALDALEADDLLMSALGPLRSRAYLTVKRAEAKAFAAHDTAYETFHHFTKF
ncbi:glutamine synthetase family protein [Bailinhaonella thermotolerans]|uniref:Glutamine synthetase n=1 Tax=Bailinhaonella thermotolerans TaxID=1070861 RepID=A0A3A4AS83_9ACTN|nr:glutamine synthetase family protein [Bailinhaonella thermotolerans]RJL31195.1 glutamine synthetase [Bailinhaonella thermotolerans]